jgi:glucosamine-6-phosphate deaminase
VRITVVDTPEQVAQLLAARIAGAVQDRPDIVLGLAAGQTPVAAYAELRRLHASGALDLSRATSFNLDEFVGVGPAHRGSLRFFMERHLFSGVNLPPHRVHFLDGTAADLEAECLRYDTALQRRGGIGLQILGIGANGHIGFNEPAAELESRTHRVRLRESSRRANAALFADCVDAVPVEALTLGVGAILQAERIVLAATGGQKAECVERTVNGPVTTWLPASLLQLHRDVEVLLDRAAASKLAERASSAG